MAPNPDRDLADARAAIDRGDEREALKRLEKARRGYARLHDSAGLEHLLVLAKVLGATDTLRTGRDNLLYAIKQNLRLEARRRAQQQGEPWRDPYPALQAPAEHTRIVITRGIKLWIALGVAVVTLVVIGFFAAAALFSTSSTTDVTVRLVNDTRSRVTVRGCDDSDCVTFWTHADLDRGLSTERDVPVDDVVEYFEVEQPGGTVHCLPLRVHDAYVHSGEQASLLVARLSAATPCPGVTVLPKVARETSL